MISAQTINPYRLQERVTRSLGSGFIIEDNGLILTNSHVVFGRQSLLVTLDDGSVVPARLVGADPIYDVAVIQIPKPNKGTLPVQARRLGHLRRGRGRDRDRQPARAGSDRHARHRQRPEPHAARRRRCR